MKNPLPCSLFGLQSCAMIKSSKWRITFAWANQELADVSLVKIEDPH
jgi:plasmid maintenance system killer protein